MKLIHIIIRNDNANKVADALVANGFYLTRLASTGGFLRLGNTVFISSIEDDQLDKMMKVIQAHTEVHVEPPSSRLMEETRVSRAVIFVQDMESLHKL
ncbi:MAG: cyclic-di-AMP receptor [Anaerolineaceae bacterium]|nr:cyclic-di-AMP receptor [Anaerolineaceae bacterium]